MRARTEAPGALAFVGVATLLWLALGWRIVAVCVVGFVGMVILGVVMRDG